jgi:hypothetical protein
MRFEVRHTNSAGRTERQSVSEGDVLALISKIDRLSGTDVSVVSDSKETWGAEEAADRFQERLG